VTNWKNIFIQNEANCPVVTDYMQYESNQEEEYCYLIYSNQFFWQPYQLKNYSTNGSFQTRYNDSDLNIAYKDALISWDGTIPGISSDDSNHDSETDYPTTSNDSTSNNSRPSSEHRTPVSTWVSVGESVINSNGFEGRVTGIINEYKVDVKFINSSHSVPVKTQYLAVRRGSSLGFSVGDYIKNNYGEKGKITGIFPDGNVSVKFKGAHKHNWQNINNLRRRFMYK
jgi:hypothetical protein